MKKLEKCQTCKIVNGTHFHQETPDQLIRVLELSRRTKLRLVIEYGNIKTGEVWKDSTPNRGHIGRSTGDCKIPLLIRTRRSSGGESVLDNCILEVRESKGGKILFKL